MNIWIGTCISSQSTKFFTSANLKEKKERKKNICHNRWQARKQWEYNCDVRNFYLQNLIFMEWTLGKQAFKYTFSTNKQFKQFYLYKQNTTRKNELKGFCHKKSWRCLTAFGQGPKFVCCHWSVQHSNISHQSARAYEILSPIVDGFKKKQSLLCWQ